MADSNKINYEEISEWLKEYKAATDIKYKKQLQNVIVVACMPLVKMIAKSLARRSTDPVEDIIQVGAVGLVKAIHFYNPDVSQNFRTYATYLITGEIRHYLRDKVAMIKAPREIYELNYRINKIMQDMKDEIGNEPTDFYLANELDISVKRVREVIEVDRRKQLISLDQMVNSSDDSQVSLFDKIADDNYYNLEQFQEDKIIIADAIKQLEEKLQEVIVMVFFEDLSQSQIARELGISQMQVSRRLKRALKQLLNVLSEDKRVK